MYIGVNIYIYNIIKIPEFELVIKFEHSITQEIKLSYCIITGEQMQGNIN